jgi:hypothetical protein
MIISQFFVFSTGTKSSEMKSKKWKKSFLDRLSEFLRPKTF